MHGGEENLASVPEADRAFLLKQALVARQGFRLRRLDARRLADLYDAYHSVPDVNGFVRRGMDMFPRLCCGLASVHLRSCLGGGVVTRGFYGPSPHTFLVIRSLVVDITADQFGGPEVYVGPLKLPWAVGQEKQRGRRTKVPIP